MVWKWTAKGGGHLSLSPSLSLSAHIYITPSSNALLFVRFTTQYFF